MNFKFFHLIIFFVLCLTFIFPQNSGIIKGKIYDKENKSPLIGANVIIVETMQGTATDLNGAFDIDNIIPGSYRVKVSYLGYMTKTLTDIVINSSRPKYLEIELKQDILENIKDIVVESEYFETRELNQVSIKKLSQEEIRRYPGGFEDVVRTVSSLPGVTVNLQGGRNDLLVRGGGPSENLYVINNIEVPNINHFGTQGASSGSLSFINLDFVDNVKFSTGGFDASYGDKMSSILSLTLTEGRNDRIGAKGTISATQFGINVEGPLSSNGNFIVSLRRSYLDFIFKAAGLPFVPVYNDINFIANYNLSQNDKLFVLGLVALDNVDRQFDNIEDKVTNAGLLDNSQTQIVSGINYRHIYKSGYSDLVLNWNRFKYDFSQADTQRVKYFNSDALESEIGLKYQRFWQYSKYLNIQFGLGSKFQNISNKTSFAETIYDLNGNQISIKNLGINPTINLDFWNTKYFSFVSSDFKPINNIVINTGLRLDYYTSINKSLYLSPRVTLRYDLDKQNIIKLSYGHYYQSPSAIWLVNKSNKNLKALRNEMVIFGWNFLLYEDYDLNFETFYKKYTNLPTGTIKGISDYIVQTSTGATYGGRQDNFRSFGYSDLVSLGTGKSYGLELSIQKKLSETPYYGQISITIGKSEVIAFNGQTYFSPFDQRFIFNINGGYKFGNSWELSGKFRFFSGIPFTPVYIPSENPSIPGNVKNLPEEYLSDRLSSGHHLDIRIDKYYYFDNWSLIVFLDIQNIYNYKIPIPPRYDFWDNEIQKSNSIGILPSIGISAQF